VSRRGAAVPIGGTTLMCCHLRATAAAPLGSALKWQHRAIGADGAAAKHPRDRLLLPGRHSAAARFFSEMHEPQLRPLG
jgi:hypothetical protein